MNNEPRIPRHVGIIVDGNGRWALKQGKTRSYGHKMGAENLETLSQYILKKTGVQILSVYVFSTENFKRSEEEVEYLMNLFVGLFQKNIGHYQKENIKIVFSGRKEPLKKEVIKVMEETMEKTKNNTGGILNFCLNYGGHTEIIDACLKLHQDLEKNMISEITEEVFSKYLYQDLPPIDLLIRTSGEMRISNFMLWQVAYSEFYFTDLCFPEFHQKNFDQALQEYMRRDRRFGGINYEKKGV